jgi:uncharacterized protein YodC (DUF2158 family)
MIASNIEVGQVWRHINTGAFFVVEECGRGLVALRGVEDNQKMLIGQGAFVEEYRLVSSGSSEIVVGSVVRLKSGGPRMVVSLVLNDGKVNCLGFTTWGRHEELLDVRVPILCLELVTLEHHDGEATPTPIGSVG